MNIDVIGIIIFVFLCFLVCVIALLVVVWWQDSKGVEGERHKCYSRKVNEFTRFCFDCDNAYTPDDGLLWVYCPYCGKQTYGFDDESIERFSQEEFCKEGKENDGNGSKKINV